MQVGDVFMVVAQYALQLPARDSAHEMANNSYYILWLSVYDYLVCA